MTKTKELPLVTGPKARALMHHFEKCRLSTYRCPAGKWTIGWGDTGRHVKPGLVWTQAQADEAFAKRLATEFEPAVREAIGDAPTTPAQFGAMVALAYNIGVGPKDWKPGMKQGFRQSSVARLHAAGKTTAAADAFLAWNKIGGAPSSGLTRRRSAERALYAGDFNEVERLTFGEVKA